MPHSDKDSFRLVRRALPWFILAPLAGYAVELQVGTDYRLYQIPHFFPLAGAAVLPVAVLNALPVYVLLREHKAEPDIRYPDHIRTLRLWLLGFIVLPLYTAAFWRVSRLLLKALPARTASLIVLIAAYCVLYYLIWGELLFTSPDKRNDHHA